MNNYNLQSNKLVFYWLCLCALMVLCMVSIGGVTRLTNSGLSIVEWKPITGVIPPLNDKEWLDEFAKYQTSPEYKLLNNQITLEGFKRIFWLEYIHRLTGRIVGFIFFIPAAIFWAKGKFSLTAKKTLAIVSILGICQGFMGWYMVKSGLSDAPFVSHFRLTFHLLFALVIFGLLIDEAIRVYDDENYREKLENIWLICLGLIITQITLGGLTAGLDGGLIYSHFPLMGERFWPQELLEKDLNEYFFNPAIVQFFHRCCAYILTSLIFYLAIILLDKKYYIYAVLLTLGIIIQFSLGVATILLQVPVVIAALHQFFGFIIFGLIIVIARIKY